MQKNVVQLRQLLAERFPGVRTQVLPPLHTLWATGLPALDSVLHGGLRRGALTEIVSTQCSSGSASCIAALLGQAAAHRHLAALLDGVDSFDATACSPELLRQLLWIRCRKADEVLKAADLLLRDRNISLVLIDLKLNRAAELKKIPSSSWFRLQRLIEHTESVVVIFTPQKMVGSAPIRLQMERSFSLEAVAEDGARAISQLRFELVHEHGTGIEEQQFPQSA